MEDPGMSDEYVIYGRRRTGSVPIEAALTLIGAPYRVVERGPGDDHPAGSAMGQVPVVRLPSGALMTESAAILIHIADAYPKARLSPPLSDAARAAFLRWMVFVSAQIYALVWVRDDPSRLAADKAHEAMIMQRTAERRLFCWRYMDGELAPGRYMLGDDISALDLYVTVTSTFGPGRAAFREIAPRMAAVIDRVEADPRLTALWAARL
jgi:GST-like protein